ncbi:MAG: glycosyltransferase family 2 protein [Candidatus Gottesmanbacteria bacterium]
MSEIKLSIIIVKYHSEKYLQSCLASINKNSTYEIIIIDNDKDNVGYGGGCNKGAKLAKGKYLFFLNPDVLLFPNTIEILLKFIDAEEDVAIVAPLLFDEKKVPYPLQGNLELTPLVAIATFSFIHKYFPNNPFSFRYWLKDWDKIAIKEVEMVPGGTLLIRKQVFDRVGGFDNHFFLYFEETDLCHRVKKLGWRIFINPQAKAIHYWAKSTPDNNNTKRIFRQSRFYYFRKHWGIVPAVLVETFLRSSEWLAEKI